MSAIYSKSEAARLLGIDRKAVAALVQTLGIVCKDHPSNHRAHGLNEADMRRLRKALGLPTRGPRQITPTF